MAQRQSSRGQSFRGHSVRDANLRGRIAQLAARLIVESGIRDYHLAKRKAAQQLHAGARIKLPGNDEIERAIGEYQRLFRAEAHAAHLARLRAVAVQAMRLLERFEPRVVGAVLNGTADQHSEVSLHLFCEPPEEVALFLRDTGVPYEFAERRLRVDSGSYESYPSLCFVAGGIPVEVVVFPRAARSRPPLSPVDGKPMQRMNLARFEALAAVPAVSA